jgi:hypothetical protein
MSYLLLSKQTKKEGKGKENVKKIWSPHIDNMDHRYLHRSWRYHCANRGSVVAKIPRDERFSTYHVYLPI